MEETKDKSKQNVIELNGDINNAIVVELPDGFKISLQSSEKFLDDLVIMFWDTYNKLKSKGNDKKSPSYI